MTLKVGVIGVGGIARVHMPGWAASEHAEAIAGCDLDEAVLQKWGKEHGITRLTTKAEDLFSDPDIDIIETEASSATVAAACEEVACWV